MWPRNPTLGYFPHEKWKHVQHKFMSKLNQLVTWYTRISPFNRVRTSNTKGAGYWFMKHINGSLEPLCWIKEARHRRIHAYGVPFTGEMLKQENSSVWRLRADQWLPDVGDGKTEFKGAQGDFGGDGNVPELDWGSHLHSGYFYQQSMKKSLKFFT